MVKVKIQLGEKSKNSLSLGEVKSKIFKKCQLFNLIICLSHLRLKTTSSIFTVRKYPRLFHILLKYLENISSWPAQCLKNIDSSINLELDEHGLNIWIKVMKQFKIYVMIGNVTLLSIILFVKLLFWIFKLSSSQVTKCILEYFPSSYWPLEIFHLISYGFLLYSEWFISLDVMHWAIY